MNKNLATIYAAGLNQGVALVAFPAAGTILTDPFQYKFSPVDYGSLFIPQAIMAILTALLNPMFCRKWGSKPVYLAGLTANFFSMILLAASRLAMHEMPLAYAMLILSTAFLGSAFGLTVPTLNTMAALIRPKTVDAVILVLNALLGVGTALAPVFIAIFVGLGFWWGLPVMIAILTIALIVYSSSLPLPGGKLDFETHRTVAIPRLFWLFAAFALVYGMVETLYGNWVSIYMKTVQNSWIDLQSFALMTFWGMAALGRVCFAISSRYISSKIVYQLLPFASLAAFLWISMLPKGNEYLAVAAFGLAGIGCSALLPLTISFGSTQLTSMAGSVAGGVIAFYLVGYGIAAFGAGPLQDQFHFDLRQIYGFGIALAIILALGALMINTRCKTTTEEHV